MILSSQNDTTIHLISYRLSNTLSEKSSYNLIYFIGYILIHKSLFILPLTSPIPSNDVNLLS